MRTFEGLLTPAEARACEEATEDEIRWLAYFADGDIEPAIYHGSGGWCIGEYGVGQGLPDSEAELTEAGLLGFAPYPHEKLPMATAPRIEDHYIFARIDDRGVEEVMLVFWCGSEEAFCEDDYSCYRVDELAGWSPIVTTKEVPDGP